MASLVGCVILACAQGLYVTVLAQKPEKTMKVTDTENVPLECARTTDMLCGQLLKASRFHARHPLSQRSMVSAMWESWLVDVSRQQGWYSNVKICTVFQSVFLVHGWPAKAALM